MIFPYMTKVKRPHGWCGRFRKKYEKFKELV